MSSEKTNTEAQDLLAQGETKADRVINWLVVGFFIFALCLAPFYNTWVYTLIVLGVNLALFLCAVFLLKNRFYCMLSISVLFASFMLLNIYQMHGLDEMHYAFFIYAAILILYQDWRIMIPYSLITLFHHSILIVLLGRGQENLMPYFKDYDESNMNAFFFHFFFITVMSIVCGWWAYIYKQNSIALINNSTVIKMQNQSLLVSEEELKANLEELQMTQDQLEIKNRELGQFLTIVSKTDNLILITDKNGLVTWVNDSFTMLTQYTPEEIIGKKPGSILQGEDTNPETKKRIKENLRKGISFSEEVLNYRKDGTPYWITMMVTPIMDNNVITNFLAIENDITERKQQESKLQKLNQELMGQKELILSQQKELNSNFENSLTNYESSLVALIENTNDVIWQVNENYELINFNTAFAGRMLRLYKINPYPNLNLIKILSHIDNGEVSEKYRLWFERALTEGAFTEIDRYRYRHKDYYAEFSFNPIYNKENKVTGVSVFGKNITEKYLAEKELKDNEQNLKEINAELDTFIYRTNHDLKAPITTIKGVLEIAKKEANNLYYDMIYKNTEKLEMALNSFLQLSNIHSKQVKFEVIDFYKVLGEVHELQKENIRLDLSIKTQKEFKSSFDLLKMAFDQLVSNAIKFKKDGSTTVDISISIVEAGNMLIIEFKDDGIGIPKLIQSNIFDMFYRGNTRSGAPGLGLYYCRKIVQKLNGKVRVESEINKGANFIIELPFG